MQTTKPKRLVFVVSLIFLLSCTFVLLLCGFFASIDLIGQVAPKAVGGLFMFSVGMLMGIYFDKNGLRRPDATELSRKLPVVVGGAVMTLLAIGWLSQIDSLKVQLARYNAACKIALSPVFNSNVAEAQRDAADAQAIINQITFVRRPPLGVNPCA